MKRLFDPEHQIYPTTCIRNEYILTYRSETKADLSSRKLKTMTDAMDREARNSAALQSSSVTTAATLTR